MQNGDLVAICFPDYVAGALTALKYAKRMEARIAGKIGLVIKDVGNHNLLVLFGQDYIVINKRFLEVVNESW